MTVERFLEVFPLYYRDRDGNSVVAPAINGVEAFKKRHLGRVAIEFIEKKITDLSFVEQIDNPSIVRMAWLKMIEGYYINFFFEEHKRQISYVDNSFERQLYNGWLQLIGLVFDGFTGDDGGSVGDMDMRDMREGGMRDMRGMGGIGDIGDGGMRGMRGMGEGRELGASMTEAVLARICKYNKELVYYIDYSEQYLLNLSVLSIRDESLNQAIEKLERKWKSIKLQNTEKIANNVKIQDELEKLLESYKIIREAQNYSINTTMLLK